MRNTDHETRFIIFLSHAKEDKPAVRELAKCLRNDGFEPWLDEERLLPGQDWEFEIEKALGYSGALLLCFSEKSISKEGYIQKEFRRAMSIQDEKPDGEIFVIPVRLDDCEMPTFIKKLQWTDFPSNYKKIVQSLETRRNRWLQHEQIIGDTRKMDLKTISPEIISKAIREIEKKKNEMPKMRPGYDLGTEAEFQEIGPSQTGTSAIVQFYEHGIIVWHINGKHEGKAFAVYGAIGSHYQAMLKNNNWIDLGLPITDEYEAAPSPYQNNKGEPSTGRYNLFEKGEIVWCWLGERRDQLYVITDPIRKIYDSLGGTGSYLGFPLTNTYMSEIGQRSDFEAGSIVTLANRGTHVVRQLLRINYSESPFSHDWMQYAGPEDHECAAVRLDTTLGKKMNIIAFNFPWENRAIRYPADRFPDGALDFRYCGLTVKSLSPYDQFRFYIRIKTNKQKTQYLDFETNRKEYKYSYDKADAVDYWQIPLPSESNNGDWHTFVIDIQQSSLEGFTTRFEWLKGFHFRGHVGIADLMVSDSREAIEAVAVNPIFVE